MKNRARSVKPKSPIIKRVAFLLVFLLLLYAVIPHIRDFSGSLDELKHVKIGWVVLGLVATALTFFVAASQYYALAFKKISLMRTFAVENATAFVNRLLPAGIGGISLNVHYLKKNQYSDVEAGTVVAVNNLLGIIGNIIVLVFMTTLGVKLSFHFHVPFWAYLVLVLGLLAILTIFVFIKRIHRKLVSFYKKLVGSLSSYRKHPSRLFWALILAIILSFVYTMVLFFSMRSVGGISLSVFQVFVIYIGCVVVATVTPTPGGLVGAEAALTAGFVAYGASPSIGLAIALAYRMIVYWLPLLSGVIFFMVIRRKKII